MLHGATNRSGKWKMERVNATNRKFKTHMLIGSVMTKDGYLVSNPAKSVRARLTRSPRRGMGLRIAVPVFLAALLAVPLTQNGILLASPEAKSLLLSKGCSVCHNIPGVEGTYAKLGPSLKGLSNRDRIAGGILENNTENLKVWLKNPIAVKPNTLMPNMGLSDQEIDILIKFFDTL